MLLSEAYLDAMDRAGIRAELRAIVQGPDDPAQVRTRAAHARDLIRRAGMPDDLRKVVLAAYQEMGR